MTDVSLLQRIVLVLLIGASAGFFWLRLPRVRDFLWEVMLQGKVIRQRPAAGLAHAFVFWGFCAFALITINHILVGFGGRLLSPESGFGRFYFGFVAVW